MASPMNHYDTKHLRLLGLIDARRWAELSPDDMQEIRVLMVCKYVTLSRASHPTPTISLNPEGQHYFKRLSQLALRGGQQAPRAAMTV